MVNTEEMLGWFIIGEINLNKEMVERGYAWKYDGGTKEKFNYT